MPSAATTWPRSSGRPSDGSGRSAARRPGVQEAAHPQAQLGMLAQLPGQVGPEGSGAEHQRPLGEPAPPVRRAQERAGRQPEGDDQPGRQQRQPGRAPRGQDRQQEQHRQRDGGQDPGDLVGDAQADPQPVQAGGGQPGQHGQRVQAPPTGRPVRSTPAAARASESATGSATSGTSWRARMAPRSPAGTASPARGRGTASRRPTAGPCSGNRSTLSTLGAAFPR